MAHARTSPVGADSILPPDTHGTPTFGVHVLSTHTNTKRQALTFHLAPFVGADIVRPPDYHGTTSWRETRRF